VLTDSQFEVLLPSISTSTFRETVAYSLWTSSAYKTVEVLLHRPILSCIWSLY